MKYLKLFNEAKRFDRDEFDIDPNEDIFAKIEKLKSKGIKANAITATKLVVKWPNSHFKREDIIKLLN